MDIQLIERGNGGDLVKKPKDLSVIEGFENMPYIALFGGNVAASTPTKRVSNEQAFDFWGNSIFPNDLSIQFNSITEKTLNSVALTSAGRIVIQQAVIKDLQFMTQFAIVNVNVSIVATDKIIIGIRLQQPPNLQAKDFLYIWDATNKELLAAEISTSGGGSAPIKVKYFGPEFDFSFE